VPVKTYVLTEILDYVDTHASQGGAFGISQSELAQSLGYHPCSMSRPLGALVTDGKLEVRRGNARGGERKQLVYQLTPVGRENLRRGARFVPMLPSELPVPPRPFLGRKEELGRLTVFSHDLEPLIWVDGAPGMGKTALVAQHVWRLKRGRVPFWFTARPGSSTRHFLEAISHALSAIGATQLAYYAGAQRAPTGREVANLVLRALGDLTLLGVLDDIHLAGPDLRSFLGEFLPPLLAEGKVLFFVVGQDPPLPFTHGLTVNRLTVGGLDRAAAHELTDRQGGLADRFEAVYQSSLGSPLMLQLAVQNPGVEASPSTLPAAVVAKMTDLEVASLVPVALSNVPLPASFLHEFGRMPKERIAELTRLGTLHAVGEGRVELLESIRRPLLARAGPRELEGHRTLATYYSRSHRPEAVRERFLHLVGGEDWRSASELLAHEERKILSLGYSDALRSAFSHMSHALPPGAHRFRVLRVEAELLRAHSEYSEAILLLRRAIADTSGDRRFQAECLLHIVELHLRLRQVENAESVFAEAKARAPASKRLRASFLLAEARLVEAKGDLVNARQMFEAAFELAQKDRRQGVALEALAAWSRQTSIGGAHQEALRMVEQGLPWARASGRTELVFNLLLVRARAYQETGKRDLADLEMRKIKTETEALGHLNQLSYTLSGLVAMSYEAGRWTEGAEFGRQAVALSERLGNDTVLGHTLASMATGELRHGHLQEAREYGERSILILSRLPVSDSLVFARSYLAEVYVELAEGPLARREYDGAIELAGSMGMDWWVQALQGELKGKIEALGA
jgi:tetratricopeptide (TPR) repeat protein